jgi:hypothetical protein
MPLARSGYASPMIPWLRFRRVEGVGPCTHTVAFACVAVCQDVAVVEYATKDMATLAKKGLPVVPVDPTKKLVVEWENESVALHGPPTTVVQLMGVAIASEVRRGVHAFTAIVCVCARIRDVLHVFPCLALSSCRPRRTLRT